MKKSETARPGEIGKARALYQEDDIEIDDDALVSRAEDGFWVQAWVWVGNDD